MDPGAHSPDVAICGGGLVGATLALALAELSLDVVLIEAHPFGTFGQPSFDDRTTAISNGSRRIFEALRVWPCSSAKRPPSVAFMFRSRPLRFAGSTPPSTD